jgi:hypothetical protein
VRSASSCADRLSTSWNPCSPDRVRAAALRFLAFSIRAIQRIDGTRLAVTEIPSDRRFRAYGPPTSQHRHDPALMSYLLEQADAA